MKNIKQFINYKKDEIEIKKKEIKKINQNSKKINKLNKEIEELELEIDILQKLGRNISIIKSVITIDTRVLYILLKKYDVNELVQDSQSNSGEDILSEYWLNCIKYKDKKCDKIKYKSCLYKLFKMCHIHYVYMYEEHRYGVSIDVKRIIRENLLDLQYSIIKKSLEEFYETIKCLESKDIKEIDYDKIFSEKLFNNMNKNNLISERQIKMLMKEGLKIRNDDDFFDTVNVFLYDSFTSYSCNDVIWNLNFISVALNIIVSLEPNWIYFLLKNMDFREIIDLYCDRIEMVVFRNYFFIWNVSENADNDFRINKEACIYLMYEKLFPFGLKSDCYLLGMQLDEDMFDFKELEDYEKYRYKELDNKSVIEIWERLVKALSSYVKEIDMIKKEINEEHIDFEKALFNSLFEYFSKDNVVNIDRIEYIIRLLRGVYYQDLWC